MATKATVQDANVERGTRHRKSGTGTYLLGVIEHALGRVEAEQGAGAVAGQATALANNLYGFELSAEEYAALLKRLKVSSCAGASPLWAPTATSAHTGPHRESRTVGRARARGALARTVRLS